MNVLGVEEKESSSYLRSLIRVNIGMSSLPIY